MIEAQLIRCLFGWLDLLSFLGKLLFVKIVVSIFKTWTSVQRLDSENLTDSHGTRVTESYEDSALRVKRASSGNSENFSMHIGI